MNVDTVNSADQRIAPSEEKPTAHTAVCTLFEGDYHLGLGALANSLVKHGYHGVIWAGYRGPLPPWASPVRTGESFSEFQVSDRCVIRFVPLAANVHFTNYKAEFMLQVFRSFAPDIEVLHYFDPDIVIKCRWSLFEEWADCGVALVKDVNFGMTATHPFRSAWIRYANAVGIHQRRDIDFYCNAGFIAVRREWIGFLDTLKQLIDGLPDEIRVMQLKRGGPSDAFHAPDQDLLNSALMCTDEPLSIVGPEGMDFIPGGFMMSHATGGPKPWHKRMLASALGGVAPRAADKAFWQNVSGPIPLFKPVAEFWKRVDLTLGSAVGRFIRRA